MLHYGAVPNTSLDDWDFRVWGAVEKPLRFDWDTYHQMPRKAIVADIHCVTRWSRLDASFEGVAIQHVTERARPTAEARYAIIYAEQGYTTSVPIEVLDDDDVILADAADGRIPDARTRLSPATRASEALLLEVRQVDPRSGVPSRRSSWAFGSATDTTTTQIRGRKSASLTVERAPSLGLTAHAERSGVLASQR